MKIRLSRLQGILVVTLLVILAVGGLYLRAESEVSAGKCPICGTEGIPIPSRDNLEHCECEKWWRGQSPARLVFADCSKRQCAESAPNAETPLIYVDLHLYRCPNDGLLFTDPQR